MRLSQAILLGDSLKKCNADKWLTPDGSCGCAFGGALLAVGVDLKKLQSQIEECWRANGMHSPYVSDYIPETPIIKALWPWLTNKHLIDISMLYFQVADKAKTIEDVCAYVRSIEPAEEEYIPDEEPWTDSKTTAEMMNSIKGR